MKLIFDTESTGLPDLRAPADCGHQPRLVQLGAILTDDLGAELGSINAIIKPEGFVIPDEAAGIHGITTQMAMERGVDLSAVLPIFASFCLKAHVVIAHNLDFDRHVMTGEFLRAGFEDDPFTGPALRCTMHAMTPICQLPGRYGDFKWPKLQEAHKHAFGTEFDGAHGAMADANACKRIYFWLEKYRAEQKAKEASK